MSIFLTLSQTGTMIDMVAITVEPVSKDHLIRRKNMVSQDRWSLVTGSIVLKCKAFCQECVPSRQVVSQDRFHCTPMILKVHSQTKVFVIQIVK